MDGVVKVGAESPARGVKVKSRDMQMLVVFKVFHACDASQECDKGAFGHSFKHKLKRTRKTVNIVACQLSLQLHVSFRSSGLSYTHHGDTERASCGTKKLSDAALAASGLRKLSMIKCGKGAADANFSCIALTLFASVHMDTTELLLRSSVMSSYIILLHHNVLQQHQRKRVRAATQYCFQALVAATRALPNGGVKNNVVHMRLCTLLARAQG
jgi:hypothetical protein